MVEQTFTNHIFMSPFEEKRAYFFALVCLSVRLPRIESAHLSWVTGTLLIFVVTGSKVKVTKVKLVRKPFQIVFPKMNFFFIHLCNLF